MLCIWAMRAIFWRIHIWSWKYYKEPKSLKIYQPGLRFLLNPINSRRFIAYADYHQKLYFSWFHPKEACNFHTFTDVNYMCSFNNDVYSFCTQQCHWWLNFSSIPKGKSSTLFQIPYQRNMLRSQPVKGPPTNQLG